MKVRPRECRWISSAAAAGPDPELDPASRRPTCRCGPFSPPDVFLPELISELRRSSDPPPNVGLNYVFCGEPDYHGGPFGEPCNAQGFSEAPYSKPEEAPPAVAVLDPATIRPAAAHPGLAWRVDHAAGDQETGVLPSGYIAAEGGHSVLHRWHHYAAGPARLHPPG